MSAATPICVVLPTRDRRALALRALGSVFDQLEPDDELLVVDNGSSDGTGAAVADLLSARFPRGRVVFEPRRGISHARNRALREATVSIVAFIDDDELADPGWLAGLRCAWRQAGARVAAIGGPMRPDWQAARPAWLEDYLLYVISVLDLGPVRRRLDQTPGTGYLWGGNMSFLRETVLELGGFHPDDVYLGAVGDPGGRVPLRLSTARSGEEQEMQNRLVAAGWEVWYEPAAAVDHLIPPERLERSFFVDFHRQQAALALLRGRPRTAAFRPMIREAARYLFFGLRRHPRATSATFGLAGAWTLATGKRTT